jgi:hypothetical protein
MWPFRLIGKQKASLLIADYIVFTIKLDTAQDTVQFSKKTKNNLQQVIR